MYYLTRSRWSDWTCSCNSTERNSLGLNTAGKLQENLARKQNGEEPLPEEDPQQFKPLDPPSLVNSYLLQEQLSSVCEAANTASCELLHKLNIADCLRN